MSPNALLSSRRHRLFIRLVIGLVQGLVLDSVDRTPMSLSAQGLTLTLIGLLLPVVWLECMGRLPQTRIVVWAIAASLVIIAFGLLGAMSPSPHFSGPWAVGCLPLALIALHSIIEGRDVWTTGTRLALASLCVLIFWLLVLAIGALATSTGISGQLPMPAPHVWIIVGSPIALALGFEQADRWSGAIERFRQSFLTLLSFLLPVAVVVAGVMGLALGIGHLLNLPFGRHPAGPLLIAAAALQVLAHAALQRDEIAAKWPRIGTILILPIAFFAAYAVLTRVAQYGFTTERVLGLAAAVIALVYGLSYLSRSWCRESWARLALPVFIAIVMLAFASPWLNPSIIAYESQAARLAAGEITQDEFETTTRRMTIL